MLSRETEIIAGFVVVALVLTDAGFWLTELPDEVSIGVLFLVGIVVPIVGNDRLDDRESG